MSEAENITAGLRAVGRLHTRVDVIAPACVGPINASMASTLDSAHSAALAGLGELVRVTRGAIAGGAPTTVDAEAIYQARAVVDQQLARIDAVLFDVVATAEG